ncbi:MAG: hypothetical protein QM765_14800 [Myxococcales bacterium]
MGIGPALSLALVLCAVPAPKPSLEVAYLRALELQRKIGQGGRPRDLAGWAHELAGLAAVAKGSNAGSADVQQLRDSIERGAESTLANLAVRMHNEAKKHRSTQLFLLANRAYEDYLPLFPENRWAYDLRFFHAELLNDNLNRYEEAAAEYTRVLQLDIAKVDAAEGALPGALPGAPGRWMLHAAYNAVLAYDEVAKREEKDEVPPSADPKIELPIPKAQGDLLAACERYLKYAPKGERYVSVLYKTAYTYYRYNHFDEAVPRLARVALELPDHDDLGPTSATLILDTYVLLGDWAKVQEWARRFLEHPRLGKGKFREELRKTLDEAASRLSSRQAK